MVIYMRSWSRRRGAQCLSGGGGLARQLGRSSPPCPRQFQASETHSFPALLPEIRGAAVPDGARG